MATTYIDSDAAVFGFGTTSGSTPTFTQGSTDRYIFGGVGVVNFGAFTIDQLKYGGSGGTTLPAIVSDQAFYGGAGLLRAGDIAPGPSGTSDVYGEVSASLQVGVGGVAYDGVDQTTPLSDATSVSGIEGGVTTEVASVVIPNCTSGQTIVAFVYAASESFSISAFTAISGTTIRAQALGGSGEEFAGVAILEKVAGSSGSITIEVNCNCTSSGAIAWAISGGRINEAAGSGSTGTLARTNANDTSSASGTTTVTGALARTNANDTSAGSGTTTVTGTLARTNANDTSAASGAVGAEITGTVARTNANDTSTASGTTTVTGTLARTNANDTAAASGTAGTPTGTVNYTNRNDTLSAAGSTPGAEAVGGWGTYYPRKRKRIEPIDALPQGLEAIQEDADKRQKAIQARQALRRAEMKDQQVTAQLRQIYAEQDALKRGVLKAKAQKAAEQDDEDAIAILFALAS